MFIFIYDKGEKKIILNLCLECPCAVNDKWHAECKTGEGGKIGDCARTLITHTELNLNWFCHSQPLLMSTKFCLFHELPMAHCWKLFFCSTQCFERHRHLTHPSWLLRSRLVCETCRLSPRSSKQLHGAGQRRTKFALLSSPQLQGFPSLSDSPKFSLGFQNFAPVDLLRPSAASHFSPVATCGTAAWSSTQGHKHWY